MQTVTDTNQTTISETEVIRPFGPSILKTKIPPVVLQDLIEVFENHEKSTDHSLNLAGNMYREFTIDDKVLPGEKAKRFVQMLGDGSGEIYKVQRLIQWENTKRSCNSKHYEIVNTRIQNMSLTASILQSWGNISKAGDFNPMHTHSGMISGVGYVKIPDNIEYEWECEDHDVSAGCIQFTNGAMQGLNVHSFRLKPEVGDLYFFPAWLMHEVYPFRSKGERWSFSFNTNVDNLNADLELTDADKIMIHEHREKMLGRES